MSIRKNIEDIMSTINAGDTGLAEAIQQDAVLEIKAGEGSKELEIFLLARNVPTPTAEPN